MTDATDTAHTNAWLHDIGIKVDHAALDRIADVILDGTAAVSAGEPHLASKLVVLIKVQAMLLAAMKAVGDAGTEKVVESLYVTLGDILRCEVKTFERAVRKDQRRAVRHMVHHAH